MLLVAVTAGIKSANRLSVYLLEPNRCSFSLRISQVQSTMICAEPSIEIIKCVFLAPDFYTKVKTVIVV